MAQTYSKIFNKVNKIALSVANMTDTDHPVLGGATYSDGSVTPAAAASHVEVPILEDSVTVNTGEVDKTEIKLIGGDVWTSKSSKGDTDISFQIPAVDEALMKTFFNYDQATKTFGLDVCKASGSVIFSDDNSNSISFPTADIYASLVIGDGDNPAYINCTVVPTGKFSASWISSTSGSN